MNADKLAELSSRKFEGLSRAELKEAAEILGLNFGPNTSEGTMRLKLCEKVGQMPAADPEPVQPSAKLQARISAFDPKPNLTTSGKWGGLRHNVTIFQQGADSENSNKYVRLYNECEPRDYAYGKVLDLPEPYYQSLKLAEMGRLEEKKILDNDGMLVRIDHIEIKNPRYPHQYHGVVPGTELLPRSVKEYWQRQAVKTNNFDKIPRRVLTAIRADLYGPVGPAFYKDLTDQDILASILEFLGVDQFAEAA